MLVFWDFTGLYGCTGGRSEGADEATGAALRAFAGPGYPVPPALPNPPGPLGCCHTLYLQARPSLDLVHDLVPWSGAPLDLEHDHVLTLPCIILQFA